MLVWLPVTSVNEDAGKKICGYAASAKSTTALNYCGIDSNDIIFVVDDTPAKQGKFLPGSHIPIVAAEAIRNIKPNIIIILPWDFRAELCKKLNFI